MYKLPPSVPKRRERSGDSVALLRDDKVGRNGPLEQISSSSGPLSQSATLS